MTIREQNEKKKEYLSGYRRMTLKINSLAEQMRSISEIAESAKATVKITEQKKNATTFNFIEKIF